MPGVFISYRRDDSAGYAGRLFDILSEHFGRENIFMDLDTIEGGDDFSAIIEQKIDISDILLAVMGSRWLTITDENGNRRLDDTHDFVRIEIAKALERGIRVIPVIVGGATMPPPGELPDDLRPLCERQALEVRDSHFHPDSQQLIDVLQKELHGSGFRPASATLRRSLLAILCVAAVIGVAYGILVFQRSKRIAPPPANTVFAVPSPNVEPSIAPVQVRPGGVSGIKNSGPQAVDISGKWTATVKYDWGDTYKEIFTFEVDDLELSGVVGFLGTSRAMLDGKINGKRVSFMTKTLTTTASPGQNAEDRHYYKGAIDGETIQFTMVTDSTVTEHTPIHFTATKLQGK